jgi:sulfur carrier protein
VKITLNGKPRAVDDNVSVMKLVEMLAVKPQVAVAVNGEVVRRADWDNVEVREGDVVEIVRAVGGGL